jgi:hypothetical protein
MPRYRVPYLAAEGVPTSKGIFTSIGWRALPLPLAFQADTQHSDSGTSDVVGQIVDIVRDSTGVLAAVIDIDLSEPEAHRAMRAIERGGQGISIDAPIPLDAVITEECLQFDDEGWCVRAIPRFSAIEVGGATLTPIPAFESAIVDPERLDTERKPLAMVASAAMASVPSLIASSGLELTAGAAVALQGWQPQEHHFAPPVLTPESNYINLDDDGRLWGWIAPAERCHQGIPGQCILAANESPDLSDFLRNRRTFGTWTGYVGFLTMDVGHQPFDQPAARSPEHYDNTANIAAIVTAGVVPDGEYSAGSVWFAGSINPTLSAWQREVLLAAQASGDWRGDPGDRIRTLRAALVVPVPGFLRKREPVLASGACGCGSTTVTLNGATPLLASVTAASACSCSGVAAAGTAPAAAFHGLTAEELAALRELATERQNARLADLDAAMPDPLEILDASMTPTPKEA